MKKKTLLIAVLSLLAFLPGMAQQPNEPAQGQRQPSTEQGQSQGQVRHHHASQYAKNFRVAGVWQKVNVYTDSAGVQQEMFLPVWKVLQGDGHFTNFVMTHYKAPAFITQEGDFRVVSDKYYSERTRQSVVAPEFIGVEVMMEYTLDEEKGEMRVRFMVPNSDKPVQETWRRVRLEVPQQLLGQ